MYTFKDWYEGKFYLNTCSSLFNSVLEYFPGIGWNEIKPKDALKIKAKQKELFESLVKEKLSDFKSYLEKDFKNSQLRKFLIDDEIKKWKQILRWPINKKYKHEFYTIENITFSKSDFMEIHEYFNKHIKKGQEIEYDFIHSPNFIYQDKTKAPIQCYTQAAYEFYIWLIDYSKKLDHKSDDLSNYFQQEENKRSLTDIPSSKKQLKDIWIKDENGNPKLYDEIIKSLLENNAFVNISFLSKIEGKLTWQKIPTKGWRSYLAGFVYTCMRNELLRKDILAPDIVFALRNTFNFDKLDSTIFKSLYVNPPIDEYLKPFKFINKLKISNVTVTTN